METTDDNILAEAQSKSQTIGTPVTNAPPVADSAMATGTDDEPEMTIADKHTGETTPDLDGDGELTLSEAATLLGDTSE